MRTATLAFVVLMFAMTQPSAHRPPASAPGYRWLSSSEPVRDTVFRRFPPPPGFRRTHAAAGSFGEWLRGLPLKPAGSPVLRYDGQPIADQASHGAVIDIDVGRRDLQQCADAVLRLRAEYLFAAGRPDEIYFTFTSGDVARYADWRAGMRPVVRGSNVRWARAAARDDSYAQFRAYLDSLFTYAGTISLQRDTLPVRDVRSVQAGDVFVDAGSPGHAVLVIDVAESASSRAMLLAQGFMPAQSVHVLKNPAAAGRCWFAVSATDALQTPHWTFRPAQLRRFAQSQQATSRPVVRSRR